MTDSQMLRTTAMHFFVMVKFSTLVNPLVYNATGCKRSRAPGRGDAVVLTLSAFVCWTNFAYVKDGKDLSPPAKVNSALIVRLTADTLFRLHASEPAIIDYDVLPGEEK